MTCPRVVVVVLNWNAAEKTLECLRSLQPSVEAGVARVVVVDNASTDGSVQTLCEWLAANHCDFENVDGAQAEAPAAEPVDPPAYSVLRSPRNGGYAAGNNLGIRFALRHPGTEFVFVLNNDATVDPPAISRLLECADRRPRAGAIGSTLIESGGMLRIAGGSRYHRLVASSKPVLAQSKVSRRIDYVSGAAMFIRRSALARVGLLCEDYFLYFEELDFARRLLVAGFEITWCPESIVYHEGGYSAGSRSGSRTQKSKLAEYHSNLSCLIFLHKFHPRLIRFAAPIRFLLKTAHHIVHRQSELVMVMVQAYRDYRVWLRCART